MPTLLDLPNELLCKILDDIYPDDIPNFALTCKDIYLVAGDAVKLHLDREDTYEDIVLHGCHRHEDNAHPLHLIEEMCMDWRVGEYVKTLTVECCGPCLDPARFPGKDNVEDTRRYRSEQRKDNNLNRKIMPAIRGCIEEKAIEWCLPPPNCFVVKFLCDEAERGERSAMVALLLLFFLPNIEAICLSQYTWSALHLRDTILSMSKRDPQQSSRARKPFMSLKEIDLRGSHHDLIGEDVDVFGWFTALPSMQKLCGDFVEGNWQPEQERTIVPHTSNVTEIRLSNSAIRFEHLERLFFQIRSLERFTYHHNEQMAEGIEFKAHTILAALLRHAKHSLTFLAMFGSCDTFEEEDDGLFDLRGFQVLKEIRLNIGIYYEALPYRIAPDGRRPREDFQPLVYALPRSIETVSLCGLKEFHHVAALFVDFAEKKDLRLPNLDKVRFRGVYQKGHDKDWAELREMCEGLGVTLETKFS